MHVSTMNTYVSLRPRCQWAYDDHIAAVRQQKAVQESSKPTKQTRRAKLVGRKAWRNPEKHLGAKSAKDAVPAFSRRSIVSHRNNTLLILPD